MIEFGKTLREAREAKGLTVADIAGRTHMMSSMVADLENEDFSRLPAPIYGRGFIKLYCETVEIDPAPLVAEFMEICNGNREPAIRERAVAPAAVAEADETVGDDETDATTGTDATEESGEATETAEDEQPTETETEPAAEPTPAFAQEPPLKEQLDLFSAPAARIPHPQSALPPKPVPPAPPTLLEETAAEPTPKREHVFARYASPIRDRAIELPRFAPAVGRWCVVIALLALLAWGVIVGLKALYRATSGTTTSVPTAATAPAAKPTTVPPAPAARPSAGNAAKARPPVKTERKPIDVPPLYID